MALLEKTGCTASPIILKTCQKSCVVIVFLTWAAELPLHDELDCSDLSDNELLFSNTVS